MMQCSPSTPVLAMGYIKLQSESGEIYLVKALFDKGSEVNIMSEKLVRMLKLRRERFVIEISGVIAKQLCESSLVNTRLYPLFTAQMENGISTNFIVLKKLPETKQFEYEQKISEFEGLLLADPQFNKSSTFHLLLGVEFWAKIIPGYVIHSSVGLCAQSTAFGYVIFGSVSLDQQKLC